MVKKMTSESEQKGKISDAAIFGISLVILIIGIILIFIYY